MDTGTTSNNLSFEMTSIPWQDTGGVIGDELMYLYESAIVFTFTPFALLGVVTNAINIMVFLEQGVREDSTNIGLLCLSIFDLVGCVSLVPYPVCRVIHLLDKMPLYQTCSTFTSMISFIHVPQQQMGAWTTVYLSVMRSSSVIFPLKVKLIFTPATTMVCILLIVVFFTSLLLAYLFGISFTWIFRLDYNIKEAYLEQTKLSRDVLYYSLLITNQILAVVAAAIVSIATVLMGRKLVQVKKWRKKDTNDSQNETGQGYSTSKKPLSSKEIQLIILVNTITSIFLVCLLMGLIPGIVVMAFPGVAFGGVNQNLMYVSFLTTYLFDAVNSSINFFFYIRVSSPYEEAFHKKFFSKSNEAKS